MKRGKNLRDATKEGLLQAALQMKLVKEGQNRLDNNWWGVEVNSEGEATFRF